MCMCVCKYFNPVSPINYYIDSVCSSGTYSMCIYVPNS